MKQNMDVDFARRDVEWLEILDSVVKSLKSSWDEIKEWDSLIVNRRKPHTYRVSTKFKTVQPGAFIGEPSCYSGDVRVCLHRFEPCSFQDAFPHPHPWPGAFMVLKGSYIMRVGGSQDHEKTPDQLLTTELTAGSKYAITNPLTWHSVQPTETCYSIMVNGKPFERPHVAAPTTKGKDLDRFSQQELEDHIQQFQNLLSLF